MKFAVTAASGQLGTAIIKATSKLVGAHQVVALARSPEKMPPLGVEVRRGSYDEPETLEQSLAGVDAVLLVSGMESPERRIIQHRNVIRAATAAGAKKIVYTSVQGPTEGSGFSPIVQSNRQTEEDVKSSGLDWVIGRNGIYIEPDVEYIDRYISSGEIANCAAAGRCGYTTRSELAYAYARMLAEQTHDGNTYALHGDPITQDELARYLGDAFGVSLPYRSMEVEAYRQERVAELDVFIGTVIAGIYEGIRQGVYDAPSDFSKAAGREHQTWPDYFLSLKASTSRG